MTKLSVVIAAYNEQENIEPLLRRLHSTLSGVPNWTWEMIFVVEGRDRTREILDQLAAELGGDIRVLYNEEPSGLGNAFRRGFAAVAPEADLVLTLDADLNHQPEEIPRLIERLRESRADIVVGSRFLEGSTVEGTPFWKRFLSGVMNFFMRYLYGLRVLDKTSGFRVYRAEALRALEFRNQAFAFLPEMLIRAHNLGFHIVEEPIHFIFRREGKSKLDFWSTSWSYLTLLGTRVDRWSLIALGLIVVGLLVRASLSALTMLMALTSPPPGTLIVLGLTGLLLVFEHRFVRALYGRRIACLALLFLALPPPAFLLWTSIPSRTLPSLVLGALSLWLAAWVAGDPTERIAAFLLGLVGGLALWRWPLALTCFLPALVWLLVARPRVRQGAGVFLILAGLIAGSAPMILGDRPAGPLLETGSGDGGGGTLMRLPELFASAGLGNGAVQRVLQWPVLLIHVLAALFFLGLPWLRRPAGLGPGLGRWGPWALILGVAGTVLAVDLAAAAADLRYILPLSLLAPVMLALFLAAVGRWSRPAAVALAACILVFAVAGYPWPW